MKKSLNGYGLLRSIIENARIEIDCGLGDLTVLSARVDPYQLDTLAGHRDAKWLAKELKRAIGSTRRIHFRGLHYAIVARGNVRKPSGEIYRNTDDDWNWLTDTAGKAARWLGYVPFERITYKTNIMWDKVVDGTGYWFRNRHEQMLVGTRGNVPAPAPGTQWPSVIVERKRGHSVKPEQSYQMIEQYFPNVPKIELNCRGMPRPGWDAWGNEVEETAE